MKTILFIFFLSLSLLSFADTKTEYLVSDAKSYLGKKYVWGGTNPNFGADCSGFIQYVYKKQGVMLPRTALSQSRVGVTVPMGQWQKGDLLFFNTDKSRGIPITHVGMYLGGSKFIHAKGKNYGVTVSNISEYANSFKFAKRVTKTEPLSSQFMITTNEIKVKQLNPYTAPTKTNIAFDPLVIYNGKYVHVSELEKGVM